MANEHSSEPVASPDPSPAPGVRDRFWYQALAVVVLLAALGLMVARSSHTDVVQGWAVLASCPAPAGTAPATGHGVVNVFLEVPAESLPSTPLALEGASGSVVVSAIPHDLRWMTRP